LGSLETRGGAGAASYSEGQYLSKGGEGEGCRQKNPRQNVQTSFRLNAKGKGKKREEKDAESWQGKISGEKIVCSYQRTASKTASSAGKWRI